MLIKIDDVTYGEVTETFTNGYMTTAGFVPGLEHEDVTVDVFSVTYDSDHADCLPVRWPNLYWLDDNGMRQKIREVRWNSETGPAYVMNDGSLSYTVTS